MPSVDGQLFPSQTTTKLDNDDNTKDHNQSTEESFPILSWKQCLVDRSQFVDNLSRALSTTGFFYLTDIAVPDQHHDVANMTFQSNEQLEQGRQTWQSIWDNSFSVSEQFFHLEEQDKLEIEMIHSKCFRGYSKFGSETTAGKQDQREQIDFGPESTTTTMTGPDDTSEDIWFNLYGPNQFPRQVPSFRDTINEFRRTCDFISRRLVESIGQSVSKDPSALLKPFTTDVKYPAYSRMKVVRYPPVSLEVAKDQGLLGVGAHRDGGGLTLLAMDGTPGLQVQLWNGEWRTVQPRKYDLVINIGQVIERLTHGVYTATTHRVLATTGSKPRISIPFFYSPSLASHVTPIPVETLLPHAKQLVDKGGRKVVSEIRKGDLHEEMFGRAAWRGITRSHDSVWKKYYGQYDKVGGPDKFLSTSN
ncbi:hypothetical protein OIO90_003911 [Microbotryomycetes sp. JL221]|nr:hypothetical protein OIO90_003911 [Microbotryomycetes sp. JL221]